MDETATWAESHDDKGRMIRLAGPLTVRHINPIARALRAVVPDGRPLRVDISDLVRIDTTGAWVLYRLRRDWERAGLPYELTGGSDEMLQLIAQVAINDRPVQIRPDQRNPVVIRLEQVGAATIRAAETLGAFLGFLGVTLISLVNTLGRRRGLRWHAIIRQIEVVGIDALAIIGLMSFLVGIVIAQQGAVQLRQFGADVFVVNLVGRLTFRELGVLMTAIMVAGRSGSAFAAQIGSMKIAEEVDAMRTIGLPPIEVLVFPRLMAAALMMPLLSFYGAMCALLGGGILCWLSLGIPPVTYIQRLQEVVPMTDVWVGLIKAPVFGIIIAVTGCYQGMQVGGNAEAVGLRTTAAVVQSIFMVIVLDAFFAIFFSTVGWV